MEGALRGCGDGPRAQWAGTILARAGGELEPWACRWWRGPGARPGPGAGAQLL